MPVVTDVPPTASAAPVVVPLRLTAPGPPLLAAAPPDAAAVSRYPPLPPLPPPEPPPSEYTPDLLTLTPQLARHPHTVGPDGVVRLRDRSPDRRLVVEIWALGHVHPLAAHCGWDQSIERIRSAVRWPGMEADLLPLYRSCPACQHCKHPRPHDATTLVSTMSSAPLQAVYMDVLGPLPASRSVTHVLVIIDRFSRWVELVPLESHSAEVIAAELYNRWICRWGVPAALVTDGGSTLTARVVAEVCALLNITRHVSIAHHAQGHGVVERAIRIVNEALRTLLADLASAGVQHPLTHWEFLLPSVQFALNSMRSRATGQTPFEILHGFAPRLPIHAALGLIFTTDEPAALARRLAAQFGEIVRRVRQADDQAFAQQRRLFLAHRRHPPWNFEPGEFVLRLEEPVSKLGTAWRGPYQVVSRVNEATYVVRDLGDRSDHRVHVDQLQAYYPGERSVEDLAAEAAVATALGRPP